MRLASVQPRDIVLVSKGGRRFAHVRAVGDGVVEFTPIERGISYRHASAREVLDVWRRRRARRDFDEGDPQPAVSKAQLSLAGRLDRPAAAQG